MKTKNIQRGWQCPVCGKVYAPFVRQCDGQLHWRVGSGSTMNVVIHTNVASTNECDITDIVESVKRARGFND